LANLYGPAGVAADGAGNFFIIESGRIRKVGTDGIIQTIAGNGTVGFGGDGGPAVSAQISPSHIAADSAGNIFFSEINNHRIRRIAPDGVITTIAGTGTSGYAGDGGQGAAAQLSFPANIAPDSAGNLFVADTGNRRIRKLSSSGIISTVAGNGMLGFGGDGGPAVSATLGVASGVAVDNSGNLLIADTDNSRIRLVNSSGVITTIAGNGTVGFDGEGVPALSAQLRFPGALATDAAGDVFVIEADNQRVRRIDSSGIIQTIAGTGIAGFSGDGGPANAAQLNSPWSVAVDASGSLLIADLSNYRIRRVRVPPAGVPTIASIVPSTGVRGTTIAARIIGSNLSGATGVVFSGSGVTATVSSVDPGGTSLFVNVTVALNAALGARGLKVTTASGPSEFFVGFGVDDLTGARIISTIAGNGSPGFTGDGGGALSAELNRPRAVAVDIAGNVFIADSYNNRIRKINTQGIISTVAGTGTAGFSGDGGPGTGARLNQPADIAIDSTGNLFIADSGNHRVRKLAPTGFITTVAGTGVAGFGGDGVAATSTPLNLPSGVALDNSGDLYIADLYNNRIRMVSPDGLITTIAGNGLQGFSGDGGAANNARLWNPMRVAVNAAGDLFIVDTGNYRVRKVAATGIISTVLGTGAYGIDPTEGSVATSVRATDLKSLAFDAFGNLLIGNNNRVWLLDSSGLIYTIAGGTNTIGDGVPALTVGFAPDGIAIDASGNLLIADGSDHKIRIVSAPPTAGVAPVLTSLSATSGLQGTTVAATISGLNLSGATAVIFSGTGVTATISSGGTDTVLPITIFIAAGAGATLRNVTVVTAQQVSNSLAAFTVVAPPAPGTPQIGSYPDGTPTISVLTAAQGTMAAATILGFNLQGASSVVFSGTGVTATILPGGTVTSLPILITVAGNAPLGGYTITITASGGVSSPRSGFTVVSSAAGGIITTAAGQFFGSLSNPWGVAADSAGNVFFADSGHERIGRITPAGGVDIVKTGLSLPTDVATDSAGNLYILDYSQARILKVTPAGSTTTFAGSIAGDSSGDGGPATSAQLLAPTSVAVDSSGNVYIAELSRIRMVNGQGIINTVAGTGVTGFAGDGGPALSAQFSTSLQLAIDASNNIFVADTDNNRIRVINSAGMISTVAGNGIAGFAGDGGPAASAELNHLLDVAVDRYGNLFFVDVNNRVRMVNSAGIINTVAGNGAYGLGGDGGPATQAQLAVPYGIAVDLSGNLWISDSGINRVRKVTPVSSPAASATAIGPSSGVQGTTVFAAISGTHLSGAAAVIFSGSGVSASISPGGNDSSVPVAITIDPGAAVGLRTVTVVTEYSISAPFSGFSVGQTNVPHISSISPASGAQGATVQATINGMNLSGATGVSFDGTGITANISAGGTDTSLPVTLTISSGASTGVRSATVVTPNGTSTPYLGFTLVPSTPTVTSVSVPSGSQGTAFPATITGTNLSGVMSVFFSGTGILATISGAPTPTTVPVIISISPSAPIGAQSLIVATADRLSAPAGGLTVVASILPAISSISPALTVTGTTVPATIVGVHLFGATAVTFAGTGVTAAVAGLMTDTDSRQTVTITIQPGAAPGPRGFTVTTPNGTSSVFNGFNILQSTNPIRITSISPASVAQGSAFSATISGSNLAGATGVTFSGSGVTAVVTAATSSTILRISGSVAPDAALGNRTVTVTTPNGSSDAFNGLRVTSAPRPSMIQTVAGTGQNGYSGDGYNAAELFGPAGVAVDSAGNVFIADSGNNRVRKITPSLVISTVAGNGVMGSLGDGGPAISAELNNPLGVAIDSSGNLYIVDAGNNRIRKVNPAGVITAVAGNGTVSFSGDGIPAVNASLNFPNSVAIDSAGNLFIADTNHHRIRKVDTNGVIQTVAGNGTQGFGGDGGPALNAQLNSPAGVAVDGAGNLFIADTDNNRVRQVTPGGTISTVAGTGSSGFTGDGGPAAAAELFVPIDVKVDAAGNLLIADYENNRIRTVTAGIINTVAGNDNIGFGGDGGPATAAQFDGISGIATDAAGSVFIADIYNSRVRRVTQAGIVTTIAGDGDFGYNGDGVAALFAQFSYTGDFVVDPAGNIFIADTGNNRIRKVTPAGIVTTVAGSGTGGGFGGDGGPATSAMLNTPESVALDGAGNIFIADSNNGRIRQVTPNGVITTVAGTGVPGFSGDGGPASIAQLGPSHLAIDASGNLLIADGGNGRIRMINQNGVISTIAGNGQGGFTGDGVPAISTPLNDISGLAVDASGNILIADKQNNRVREIIPGGLISTFAGTGAADFNGDDGPASSAQLNGPIGVAIDVVGNVFIPDVNNARVRMVNSSGLITTVAGNGLFDFSGDGGPATSAAIQPAGIALDGSGNLFIAGGGRIRRVMFNAVPGLPAITSIAPFAAAQGAVISSAITGVSLTGATAVYFSGTGVTASLNGGGTATSLPITITVAANTAPGLRTFYVVTAAGTSDLFSGFTVISSSQRPTITSIVPAKGIVGTSIQAVISGSGLLGATAVAFSGSGVTAVIGPGGTDTSLPTTITMAANATLGLRTLTVTTPAGTSFVFNGFTLGTPTITGISPSIAVAGLSFPATLNGSNLTGATGVTFSGNGVVASIRPGATDTVVPVTVTISANAPPGIRDVTLVTNNAASAPFTGFTVVALGTSGVITTFAGDGTTDFKGDGGPATAAGLNGAGFVAVGPGGNVYISDDDHNRVRKVTPDGIITTVAGNGSFQLGDGGPATQAGVNDPRGIAVDNSGNLFILESFRVRKVTPNGIITTVAGNGGIGFSGDGGPATLASFDSSQAIAVDAVGNLYIADTQNNRIRKVAIDGTITTIAGNGTYGLAGDGGPATSASLGYPQGVAVDSMGNVFIADTNNQRVRKVTPGGVITTVAGSSTISFVEGSPAVSFWLWNPTYVAIDQSGNLLIVDSGRPRIYKVDSTGAIFTIAGNGDTGDYGPAISAAIVPGSIAVNSAGDLFIGGTTRVRKISYALPPVRRVRSQITSQ
jgi:sugar lactone lactonase YvrE